MIQATCCPDMNDARVVSRHSKGLVDISLLVNIKEKKKKKEKRPLSKVQRDLG
jgi:hypothetical protein